MAHDGLPELAASIAAIGENMSEPEKAKPDRFQHIDRSVAILDIGGMDQDKDEIAACVGEDVVLATFHLLAGVKAVDRRAGRAKPGRSEALIGGQFHAAIITGNLSKHV